MMLYEYLLADVHILNVFHGYEWLFNKKNWSLDYNIIVICDLIYLVWMDKGIASHNNF